MRFNKGSKVEVLITSSVPSGAWRSAEIISGNGHYYTVMYDGNVVETVRVPRKCMRPKPPPLHVLDSWAPGDILEVFESCSWKTAIVSKVLGKDCFLIRLLGSSLKVKATKADTRVRQSWQGNEWITIGQGTSRVSLQTSTGKLKRKMNDYGKFDGSDVLSPKGTTKRAKTHSKGEEGEEDRESVTSSVGSCSMDTNGLSIVSFGLRETGNSSDTESSSSDYRSIKNLGVEGKGAEEAYDVHRLELDAYRCSIERLHASGPIITWEQESWITNLRMRLNISNEEHLMQIRNLISDDNSTNIYR